MIRQIKLPESFGNKIKPAKVTKNKYKPMISAYLDGGVSKPVQSEYTIKDFSKLAAYAQEGVNPSTSDEGMMMAVTDLNQYLRNILPINQATTLFGVDERDPSDFEKSKFIRQMRVVINPNHVFELLTAGSISPLEVETFARVYPESYAEAVESVLEAVTSKQGSKVPSEITRALSVLLQVPRITPDILKQQTEEQPDKADIKLPAEQSQTNVQQVLS